MRLQRNGNATFMTDTDLGVACRDSLARAVHLVGTKFMCLKITKIFIIAHCSKQIKEFLPTVRNTQVLNRKKIFTNG